MPGSRGRAPESLWREETVGRAHPTAVAPTCPRRTTTSTAATPSRSHREPGRRSSRESAFIHVHLRFHSLCDPRRPLRLKNNRIGGRSPPYRYRLTFRPALSSPLSSYPMACFEVTAIASTLPLFVSQVLPTACGLCPPVLLFTLRFAPLRPLAASVVEKQRERWAQPTPPQSPRPCFRPFCTAK
jgi:hypothetical protein